MASSSGKQQEVRFRDVETDDKKAWLLEGGHEDPHDLSSPASRTTAASGSLRGSPQLSPQDTRARLPVTHSRSSATFSDDSGCEVLVTNIPSRGFHKQASIVDVLIRKTTAHMSFCDLVQPKTHRLPGLLMWFIVLLIAVGIAGINFISLLVIEACMKWKFGMMQQFIDGFGVGMGMFALTAMSICFALCGVSIILLFAPNCGGSGLPECKCYLNGSPVTPSFFTVKNLIARILTSILANAAGFPVGREGPTVTIGTNLAYLVSYTFAMPFVKQFVKLSENVSTLIVHEDRFEHATRINCAVGGACAMAMLFNSPIGGVLYMFEEISPASWPIELTFRAFVATTICTLVSYSLLSAVNQEIRDFVIFAWLPQNKEWTSRDLPIFIVMAAFLGAVTAYHTRMMLEVARLRKQWQDKWVWKKCGVAAETVGYCAVCILLAGCASLLADCRDIGESGSEYVRFNCPEGQYNPVASLLVTTSHSSVKLLFSGLNAGDLDHFSCAIAFVTYFALNVGLAGLPVPGGAFTATMLLGGLFGRCVAGVLRSMGFETVPGVYAVVGASAMLCGFKQMAVAVVLIVVQCVNDFNMTPIVMLSVSVALKVNRAINERGHDEEQIERKNLPYLEPEMPRSLDSSIARDLMEDLPSEAKLAPWSTARSVELALALTETLGTMDFPVLDDDRCVGTITRAHLSATLKAHDALRPAKCTNPFMPHGESIGKLDDTSKLRRSESMIMNRVNSGFHLTPINCELLPLDKIMDPTPFTIGEDMPAPRFYALFARAGETAAVVVSRDGEFRGMLTRQGIVDAMRKLAGHH